MRILIDTNIALSAFLSPDGRTADVLKFAIHAEHTICLCTWSIDELRVVVKRKFPDKVHALELFLSEFSYDLLLTPAVLPQDLPQIRDVNDLPILASAVMGDVDLLLTGDKDFDAVHVVRPVILSPDGRTAEVLKLAIRDEHTICLCTCGIDEMRSVVNRKFPAKTQALELFLSEFSYELLLTPAILPQGLPSIRDVNDLPILASAIMGDVDLLLTGDKDLEAVDVKRPVVLSPNKFMEQYG